MEGKNNWATAGIKEVPFWKDGMSVEEYEKEREYYYHHLEEVKKGTYKSLWEQEK